MKFRKSQSFSTLPRTNFGASEEAPIRKAADSIASFKPTPSKASSGPRNRESLEEFARKLEALSRPKRLRS